MRFERCLVQEIPFDNIHVFSPCDTHWFLQKSVHVCIYMYNLHTCLAVCKFKTKRYVCTYLLCINLYCGCVTCDGESVSE